MTDEKVVLNSELFNSRLDRLYNLWEAQKSTEGSPWHNVDFLLFIRGRQQAAGTTNKTCALHLWLFGYEFPDTLLALTADKKIYIVTGPKKTRHLEQLKRDALTLFVKGNEEVNQKAFDQIITHLKTLSSKPIVGRLRGKTETSEGDFSNQAGAAFKDMGEVAIDAGLGQLLQVKDQLEQDKAKLAGTLAARWLKDSVIRHIERIVEHESNESHESIVNATSLATDDDALREKWQRKYMLDPEMVEYYYCIVQSLRSNFDLRITAPPSAENLHLGSGCIVCAIGAKYGEYCSTIARTLLITPTTEQKEAYKLALETQEVVIRSLRKGTKFSAVYEAAAQYVKRKKPQFADKMTKSVGHTVGLEYKDPLFSLVSKCDTAVVENGMVFNISIGFQGIVDVKRKKPFAIWIADTVQLGSDGTTKVLTADCSSKMAQCVYYLEDEAGADGTKKDKPERSEEKKEKSNKSSSNDQKAEPVVLGARLRARDRQATDTQEMKEMLTKQLRLRRKKIEQMRERFEEGGGDVNK
eukprot:Selendium_serpulae@DN5289_c0_g1_i1.p1